MESKILEILESRKLEETNITNISKERLELFNEELNKKEEEVTILKNRVANLESDLDSKFKPNQTITLKIPQTRRPINLLQPGHDDDDISFKSFRPDQNIAKDEIEDMILNRKIDKLDKLIEETNNQIQEQIQRRLMALERINSPIDFFVHFVIGLINTIF